MLARIRASQCQITTFVGICDGCREGGNYECVHSPPLLDKLLAAAAMPLTYFADHSELLSNWSHYTGRHRFHQVVRHDERWQFALQDVLVRPHWVPGEAPEEVPDVDMDVGFYACVPDTALRAAMKQRLADAHTRHSPLMTLAPFRRGGHGEIIARYEVTTLQ